jgi:hypothetical protein
MNVGHCGEIRVACFAGAASWSYLAAPLTPASVATDVTFQLGSRPILVPPGPDPVRTVKPPPVRYN